MGIIFHILDSETEGQLSEHQKMTEVEEETGEDYMSNSTSLPVVCWHGINGNAKRWSHLSSVDTRRV